ncbi:LacI family DNA-binding transcriptional regulator [Heyndrickxia acidicola]|uniref:LacI family DNA-binding transcriptional regulator n=1 Tax=Heyndrickxia acidicola TaxID=209389 RepID=A0ABU6MNL2_9BACI|nr:LacI family DNA-binding transcriptional regulator [Heyndrickxia acidicola]MED1205968.1 LacI family DNA-binding transcriptional regulator [Heyndrickxia acidicola]
MTATIEHVAKLAGVSKATVSRVINGVSTVSEENRNKVKKAMKELNFVPNLTARNLRNQRTGNIAVVVPEVGNAFFSRLVQSMAIEAEKQGYQLLICQSRYKHEQEVNYLNFLKTKQVDGIILAAVRNEWEVIETYLASGPIVLCNETVQNATVPVISPNQEYGGYIAAKHLLEQGHTKIAYCMGGDDSKTGLLRKKGFLKAIQEFDLIFDEKYYFNSETPQTGSGFEDGRVLFYQIRNMTEPPTAIFTGSDEVAVGIITEAKKFGWNVPNDLAVIGFDNQPLASIIEPSLTTVDQPIDLIAQKAIKVLIEKINEGTTLKYENYEFPLELIIRESTIKTRIPTVFS